LSGSSHDQDLPIVSNGFIRKIASEVVLFYRSRSPGYVAWQSLTSVGVVEAVSSARSLDDLVRLTAKRSVYSEAQLAAFDATDEKPVKIIDFLLVGHLDPLMTLDELDGEGVFTGHPPQSICKICRRIGSMLSGVEWPLVSRCSRGSRGEGSRHIRTIWSRQKLAHLPFCPPRICAACAGEPIAQSRKAAITGHAVSSELLRTDTVLDNQSLLIQAFARVLALATELVVFDGHCVVDGGAGLVEIRTEVIKALSITGIVYIQNTPAAIVARRASALPEHVLSVPKPRSRFTRITL
jgi:hypothetical protein